MAETFILNSKSYFKCSSIYVILFDSLMFLGIMFQLRLRQATFVYCVVRGQSFVRGSKSFDYKEKVGTKKLMLVANWAWLC